MTSESKKKSKELEVLLGDYVMIQFKTTKSIQEIPELAAMMIKFNVEGYIVDVTENYIYLGPKPDHFNMVVDINDAGIIEIVDPPDDTPEELKTLPDPGETTH